MPTHVCVYTLNKLLLLENGAAVTAIVPADSKSQPGCTPYSACGVYAGGPNKDLQALLKEWDRKPRAVLPERQMKKVNWASLIMKNKIKGKIVLKKNKQAKNQKIKSEKPCCSIF